jgi:phosphoribosylanthranilate isomerase
MTQIKICGITNADDGIEAGRLGADFLGFNFYPPSPRYVEPARAAEVLRAIRTALGEASPKAMGVFVDESIARIAAIRDEAGLDGAQFSGDEPPEAVAQARPIRFRGLSIQTLDRLGRYDAEAYLCDAHAPEKKGGTGCRYDYEVLRPCIGRYRIVIAGGLTPETVGGVVASLRPWGVDVSSAVESAPGRKDHARLRAFVEAVRRADEELKRLGPRKSAS